MDSFPVTGECLMSTQGPGGITLHLPPPTCDHGLIPLQTLAQHPLSTRALCPACLLLRETGDERRKA